MSPDISQTPPKDWPTKITDASLYPDVSFQDPLLNHSNHGTKRPWNPFRQDKCCWVPAAFQQTEWCSHCKRLQTVITKATNLQLQLVGLGLTFCLPPTSNQSVLVKWTAHLINVLGVLVPSTSPIGIYINQVETQLTAEWQQWPFYLQIDWN